MATDSNATNSNAINSNAPGLHILIVVDMQNDFISGSLGTPEAQAILDGAVAKVRNWQGEVLYTLDTHGPDYAETQEGKRLPVPHCIKGTDGWRVPNTLQKALDAHGAQAFEKGAFGSPQLAQALAERNTREPIASIELIGICTDICVVSNALLIKAFLPEVPVSVDASLCAGVTPAAHEAALTTMESCQVEVLNR